MESLSQKIYCAFCKLERKVYTKRSVSWTNVVLSLICSWLTMLVVWRALDAKFVIFFLFYVFIAEISIRIRWRMSLPCPHCDFDPLLYKLDRPQAAARVKSKLDQVRQSRDFMLKKNNPFSLLPIMRVKPDTGRKEIIKNQNSLRDVEPN